LGWPSIEQIAGETATSTGTVRSWLSRGRVALAAALADALRDAELLADAVAVGLDGGRLDRAPAGYRRRRDKAVLPM
jgi:hypothetical protein